MDDLTVYKRDEKGKKLSKEMDTSSAKLRFKDQDIDIKKVIKIGRDNVNDVVIKDDPLISRMHAVIEQEEGMLFITDKDSTNGTYVNNNPLAKGSKVKLKNGDEILVGKTKLKLV